MSDKETQALNIIRDAYDKLMGTQFFFYNIASQFALKAVDKKLCPTMGVAHVDGVHWLVYNPDFIKYYDYKEIAVILEHEIHHFTFDHVKEFDTSKSGRRVFKQGEEEEAKEAVRNAEKEKYIHKTKNICTDRSINIHLFGLPNIRMSIADIKADFTDPEGNFDQMNYKNHLAKQFEKGDMWFKDQSIQLGQETDETIVEASCITESSFKKILKEAGYQPTQKLKDLWAKRAEIREKGKEENSKDEPDQSILDDLKAEFDEVVEEFGKLQDIELDQVKKYGTWKYYFDLLMSCPETEEAIKNIQEMDVHFGDEDGEGEGGRQSQEARDRIMMEAARNSNKHDIPGNLREHIKSLFDRYSKEAALPWNVILRRLVNASKKSIKKNDVNSRNKYAPGTQILPGYRLDPIKDVAVIWDVSGSCMDEETQTTFIKEVNMMIKAGSNVRVYYTDQDVEHIQDCKGKPMKPAQYEITGGGGTALCNGVRRALSDGYRIIIQLTDCYYNFDMTRRDLKGVRVITVSTTESKTPSFYGPTIHVNRGK